MTFSGNPDTELRGHLGIETPEEKIGRLEAEVQRLKEKALEWKRRALTAEVVQTKLLADAIGRGDR